MVDWGAVFIWFVTTIFLFGLLVAVALAPIVLLASFLIGNVLRRLRGHRPPNPLVAAFLNLLPLGAGFLLVVGGRFVFAWSHGWAIFLFGSTVLLWGLGYGYLGNWRNLFLAGIAGAIVVGLGVECGGSGELVEVGLIDARIGMTVGGWLVFGSTAFLAWHVYEAAEKQAASERGK